MSSDKLIRIGTRDSPLALWQAKTVQNQLLERGFESMIVPIKSRGDLNLETPLYEMGIVGIFTKTLDIALLQGEIDLAVHSMKDVPTRLPEGIVQAAVLKRGDSADILVVKKEINFDRNCVIATSSLRRKTQWMYRYPHHRMVSLRGNVNTRLAKLAIEDWNGAIFANAGLSRIGLLPKNHIRLDWMLPAPAQGAIVVVARKDDRQAIQASQLLNHIPSDLTTHAERMFLRSLEGGCSAPIAALSFINESKIYLTGKLYSLEGDRVIEVQKECSVDEYKTLGQSAAAEVLSSGGREWMEEIRKITSRKKI